MNSSDRILAQRYAQAYDGLAQSAAQAKERAAELQAAARALETADAFMRNPNVSAAQKIGLLQEAFAQAPAARAFLETLIKCKRYALLPEIVRHVNALLDARLGITRAEVYSAGELTDALKSRTEAALSSRYGGKVEARYHTDPSLIGGGKNLCKGELIDGSIKHQFEKMQEQLTK